MKEALLYDKMDGGKTKCHMCAHKCIISPGKRGICAVRENSDGTLFSLVYGKLISINSDDPIEKKPLFNFLPGTKTMSVATVGCNMRCRHCQNHEISQCVRLKPDAPIPGNDTIPEYVVEMALEAKCESISFTYTEPTIFMEFALDTAVYAHEQGLRNVFVSNGYMSEESTKLIAPHLDAINIDLKGDDGFYRMVCGARLAPVLDTIRLMKELGVWVEVTTLIIPGLNDSEEQLTDIAQFIASVDRTIPWHVSKFHPSYEMMDYKETPIDTIREAREMGMRNGLQYVYTGNAPGLPGESTYCPNCGEQLIKRVKLEVKADMISGGSCYACGFSQSGVWS